MDVEHETQNNRIKNSPRLLDGMNVEYTCQDGLHYFIKFYDNTATFWAVDSTNRVSNRYENIPYRHRKIRPGLIYIAFCEICIGDILCLIIDLVEKKAHVTSLMGFPCDDRIFQFEMGDIKKTDLPL